MRNLHYISALLCAAALITSCSNEEIMENKVFSDGVTLIATTGASTKTTVTADYKVNWSAGDAFYAFGGATETPKVYKATAKLTLDGTPSAGTTQATFKGDLTGDKSYLQYAVYPLSAYDSEKMTVTFPASYTYPDSNAPMFGKVNADQTEVAFNQLLSGMMRIKLNKLGNKSGSLTLAGANIAGSAALTIDDATGKATLAEVSEGTGEVKVTFANSDEVDPLVLDIPVPAATYADGIIATLEIDGASTQMYQTTKGFVVVAGSIKEMPGISDITVNGNTGELTYSKLVENVADAIKALKDGEKNITIGAVAANDVIEIPASSSSSDPVTINVNSVSGTTFTVKGVEGSTVDAVNIHMPEGSTGKLTVEKINHVVISGNWEQVTASTSGNTLVVKAGAVVKNLTVKEGNIEIEQNAVVEKLKLEADVTINERLIVPAGATMEIDLGTHQLTFSKNYTYIFEGASLKLTGDAGNKGKVTDAGNGISVYGDGAQFTMENVDYTATNTNGYGVFLQDYVSSATINIKNSTMTGKYFCVATNAKTPVGSDNTISLESSTFTADETALMVNTPTKVTATGCTFTGGWQGAFLRSGETTFDACSINLNVKSSYDKNTVQAGATSWGNGNKAPSAALTAGNKNNGAYDRTTTVNFKTSCSFSVTTDDSNTYPTIYIDADTGKPNQGVIITYDGDCKTTIEAEGVLDIRNKDGKVTLNGTAYSGAD